MPAPPRPTAPCSLSLDQGRALAWSEFGDADGRPVLFFHGGADSRLAALLIADAATTAGVRLIAPDRPGFGASGVDPGRTITSWADDIDRLAQHLDIPALDLVGHSGGGPHALAVAALLPDLIGQVAVVAGGAPRAAGGAGLGLPFRLNRWFAIWAPWIQRRFLSSHRAGLDDPATFLKQWARISSADGAMFTARPPLAEMIVQEMTEGYRPGIDGAALEGRLYYQDWGFELADVRQRVDLYYGDADPMAPLRWGHFLAERLPAGHLHPLLGEGHFSGLITHAATIFGGLESGTPSARGRSGAA